MSKILEVIGTPKFNIGDFVLHKYEWDDLDVPVAWSIDQGLITGICYCGNNYSTRFGWLYTCLVYRTVSYFPDGTVGDEYIPSYPLDDVSENELEIDAYPSANAESVIKIREKTILKSCTPQIELQGFRKY